MIRYCDGDPSALAPLHAEMAPRLRAFLLKRVRDPDLAEDLVQVTFLKIHMARDRFDPGDGGPGVVEAWCFAIARNAALDALRSRQRLNARLISDEDAPEPGFAEWVERETDASLHHVVREAMEQLSPSQREIIDLHKLQELSMAEIAQRLGVNEGAVRVRAHRAYQRLKEVLEPLFGKGGGA
ncbi:MAG: RNA polymerase sigma factor CarQ [Myxococcota bacterium]|nr:RNA polymerase sigma factor CarQ [Myxococcota bacterium]